MHHIDRTRLSNHPDPRMRAAAANAARLRSELWGFVLTRAFGALLRAAAVPLRAAVRLLGASPGCAGGSVGTARLEIAPGTEGSR